VFLYKSYFAAPQTSPPPPPPQQQHDTKVHQTYFLLEVLSFLTPALKRGSQALDQKHLLEWKPNGQPFCLLFHGSHISVVISSIKKPLLPYRKPIELL